MRLPLRECRPWRECRPQHAAIASALDIWSSKPVCGIVSLRTLVTSPLACKTCNTGPCRPNVPAAGCRSNQSRASSQYTSPLFTSRVAFSPERLPMGFRSCHWCAGDGHPWILVHPFIAAAAPRAFKGDDLHVVCHRAPTHRTTMSPPSARQQSIGLSSPSCAPVFWVAREFSSFCNKTTAER